MEIYTLDLLGARQANISLLASDRQAAIEKGVPSDVHLHADGFERWHNRLYSTENKLERATEMR